MTFLGIDPGKTGGIASVDEDGTPLKWLAMPITPAEVLLELQSYSTGPICAVLEYASASPQMGTVSAFTYGRGYGMLEMALLAANIPYQTKRAQSWQGALGCLSGGDKNVTKRMAQQLFPAIADRITHATADALLMAEYARRLGPIGHPLLPVPEPPRLPLRKERGTHGKETPF